MWKQTLIEYMLTSAALKVGQECVFKQEQIYHV